MPECLTLDSSQRPRLAPAPRVRAAGIVRGFIADCNTLADYQSVMDVNFFGAVRTTLAFLQDLKRAQGRIVNVSSLAGLIKAPTLTTYTGAYPARVPRPRGVRDGR